MVPETDAGEEVRPGVAGEVAGLDVEDGAGVDGAVGDVTSTNQICKPLGGEGFEFIVEGFH